MDFAVRQGRLEDVPAIAEWTHSTFEWGDYVADSLASWIEDPSLEVIVCELANGTPGAVCRAQLLSPSEGWLDAARVHPDFRRTGMGNALNHAGAAWLRSGGAKVIRLAVEADNPAALSQVDKLGYREAGRWIYGEKRNLRSADLSRGEKLTQAGAFDVDAAWMYWSAGDLARAGREMTPRGWLWRKLTIDDLKGAAKQGRLQQSPAGWVEATTRPQHLEVGFVATSTPEAPRLLSAVEEFAFDSDLTTVGIKLPVTTWTVEALKRAGYETKEIRVFAKSV